MYCKIVSQYPFLPLIQFSVTVLELITDRSNASPLAYTKPLFYLITTFDGLLNHLTGISCTKEHANHMTDIIPSS